MSADLDMNGFNILNIEQISTDRLLVNDLPIVTNDLAVLSLSTEGDWVDATNYIVNDIVTNDGSSYIAKSSHTSASASEPGTGASWTTYWQLIAAKGDTGNTGATGASGSGTGDLVAAQNLSDVADAATSLSNLGGVSTTTFNALSSTVTTISNDLDTLEASFDVLNGSALVDGDVGTTANKLVQLDGDGKLPAVDGSNLTNLPSSTVTVADGSITRSKLSTATDSVSGITSSGVTVTLDNCSFFPAISLGDNGTIEFNGGTANAPKVKLTPVGSSVSYSVAWRYVTA